MRRPGFAVLGCSECGGYWIDVHPHCRTWTTCRRCQATCPAADLRPLAASDNLNALRDERSHRLAAIADEEDAPTSTEAGAAVADHPLGRDAFAADVADHPLGRDAFAAKVGDRPICSDLLGEAATAYLARVRGPARASERATTASVDEFAEDATTAFPWRDDPTADAKTRMVVTAALSGDSPTSWVPFVRLQDVAFGERNRRYNDLSTHLADRYPDLWEKRTTASGFVEVRATDGAVYLLRRACKPSKRLPWLDLPNAFDAAGDPLPVRRFHDTIGATRGGPNADSNSGLSDARLRYALALLADHRKTLLNASGEPKRLDSGAYPSAQRFASPIRARDVRDGLETAFDCCEAVADDAVGRTFTMPRTAADGAVDSYAVITGAWRRFTDRLRYPRSDRPRPGGDEGTVPSHVYVIEPHQDGYAHLHAVFPGRRRLMDADDARADWRECLDIPAYADTTPWLRLDPNRLSDGWHATETADPLAPARAVPATHDTPLADGGTDLPGLRSYYSKGPRQLVRLAGESVDDLYDRADRLATGDGTARDREYALLSFQWAAGARFWGASEDLRGGPP